MTRLLGTAMCVLALTACRKSEDSTAYDDGGGGLGVGQGGAQDFGYFRDILEQGGIPGPDTIDDVGFFAEHVIDLPPPDCGADVCIHGRLGLMGNMINGADCTVVMIGMNTPVNPAELERPPLNLALVIDTSGSMSGDPMEYVRAGLHTLTASLHEGDRVSLVRFSTDAELVAQGGYGDTAALGAAIDALVADGGTNIHDGLSLGFDVVAESAAEGLQNRVLLLSDGMATEGDTNRDHILDVAEAGLAQGFNLTTIGVGENFDITLMEDLAEVGEGSFYYLEDPAAVEEVFVDEIDSFLVPLARDATVAIEVTPRWRIGGLYGTQEFELSDDRVAVTIPTLQIAGRTDDTDDESGRRGGGGAMVLELRPEDGTPAGEIGRLTFDYTDASTGEIVSDLVRVSSPLDPAALDDGASYFEDAAVEKSFVMLNIYMGFELAAEDALRGDLEGALATLRALCGSVTTWLETNADADIADDLVYVEMFIANLEAAIPEPEPAEPADPWPND